MNIDLFIERNYSTLKVAFGGITVLELLRHIQINPETVIVVRNNEVLTEKDLLQDKDKIELLSVISGG